MARLPIAVFVLLAAGPAAAVWPQPQYLKADAGGGCRLSSARFRFAYAGGSAVAPGCEVLDLAFRRYWELLFPARGQRSRGGGEGSLWVRGAQDESALCACPEVLPPLCLRSKAERSPGRC